jgi:hypothetical protein
MDKCMISAIRPPAARRRATGGEVRQLRRNRIRPDQPAAVPRGGDDRSSRALSAACLGCGGDIADVLVRLGSIWCHDCRGGAQPRLVNRAP